LNAWSPSPPDAGLHRGDAGRRGVAVLSILLTVIAGYDLVLIAVGLR
jgi:hypothetical protein